MGNRNTSDTLDAIRESHPTLWARINTRITNRNTSCCVDISKYNLDCEKEYLRGLSEGYSLNPLMQEKTTTTTTNNTNNTTFK